MQYQWDKIRNHLLGIWSHNNLSLDFNDLRQEILDIQLTHDPILDPSNIAQLLTQLKGFNPFNLQHSFWGLFGILLITLFCIFSVDY